MYAKVVIDLKNEISIKHSVEIIENARLYKNYLQAIQKVLPKTKMNIFYVNI